MLLTRYGISTWLPVTLSAVGLAALFIGLGWWWAVAPVAVAWLAVAWFFRDPRRVIPATLPAGAMLSPADGTISVVTEVDHHPATAGPAVIVRTFLSVLNVHVNRSPCDGEVVEITYTRGAFHDARSDISATDNEANLLTLRVDGTRTIGVRQVAGKVARRIVCPLKVGDQVSRGQRFGMIKFGSTAELILPDPEHVTVKVKPGDKVKGGITILAIADRPT